MAWKEERDTPPIRNSRKRWQCQRVPLGGGKNLKLQGVFQRIERKETKKYEVRMRAPLLRTRQI